MVVALPLSECFSELDGFPGDGGFPLPKVPCFLGDGGFPLLRVPGFPGDGGPPPSRASGSSCFSVDLPGDLLFLFSTTVRLAVLSASCIIWNGWEDIYAWGIVNV